MNEELYRLLKILDNEILVTDGTIEKLTIFVHTIDNFLLLAKYSYCLGAYDERRKKCRGN